MFWENETHGLGKINHNKMNQWKKDFVVSKEVKGLQSRQNEGLVLWYTEKMYVNIVYHW